MPTESRLAARHSRAGGNPALHPFDPAETFLDARFRGHDKLLRRLKERDFRHP